MGGIALATKGTLKNKGLFLCQLLCNMTHNCPKV